MLVLFENETGCAFAHDKPITIQIKRPASDGCFLAAHGSDESKRTVGEWAERSFGCAGDNHIGESVADITSAFTDRYVAARTAIRIGSSNAAQSELDRDITVGGPSKDLERNGLMNRLWPALDIGSMLMFGVRDTSERASEAHSHSGLGIIRRKRKPAIIKSELCRRHRELRVTIQSLKAVGREVSTGLPIVDLRRDLSIKRGSIESRNRTDRRLTIQDPLPKSFFADADWRYRPQAGHHNSSHASAFASLLWEVSGLAPLRRDRSPSASLPRDWFGSPAALRRGRPST